MKHPTTVMSRSPVMTTTTVPAFTEGLDLGDRKTVTCLMAADKTILSRPTIDTTPAALRKHFEQGPPRRIVLEASTPANWIYRLARSYGHEVIMAHPRQVQLIANNQHKNDNNDAELLADMGRSNPELLSPVEPRSEQQQADLALVRARARIVSMRSQAINFLRSQVKTVGARLPDCGTATFHNKITPEQLPPALYLALTPVLDLVKTLNETLKTYDRQLDTIAQERYPQTEKLQQIAGVGPLVALTFVLMVADPKRFPCSRDVGPYFGLVPRQRQSSQRDPQLSITKNGDGAMRALLVNAAHYILGPFGPDCVLRRAGVRIWKKNGWTRQAKNKAVIAVARKLAVTLHRIWVSGVNYEPFHGLPAEQIALPQPVPPARPGKKSRSKDNATPKTKSLVRMKTKLKPEPGLARTVPTKS